MSRFLVQVHGEWSGIPEHQWMDIDFEVETSEEVLAIIDKEIPTGVPYIVYDGDKLITEDVK